MKYIRYPELENQVAVVTGGTRGIGLAISEAFCQNGMLVMAVYRAKNEEAEKAVVEFRDKYSFRAIRCDVTANNFKTMICSYLALLGISEVNVLVNNAGIVHRGKIINSEMASMRAVFETNVLGAINAVQALAPFMKNNLRQKSIINIGSTRGHDHYAIQNSGIYGASKAALIHLTKTMAFELAPMRVNSVSPDRTRTTLTTDSNLIAELIDINNPSDIANMVLFLVSNAARTITGKDIMVGSSIRPK